MCLCRIVGRVGRFFRNFLAFKIAIIGFSLLNLGVRGKMRAKQSRNCKMLFRQKKSVKMLGDINRNI